MGKKHLKTVVCILCIFTYSFAVTNLSGGMTISLQAGSNNNYIGIDQSTSRLIASTATSPEQFNVIANSDGTFSLQSARFGTYVCADYSLSPPYLVANRTAIGPWEKFHIVYQGNYNYPFFSLLSYNNTYVSADLSLSAPYLVANRTAIGPWEKFSAPNVVNYHFGVPLTMNIGTYTINDYLNPSYCPHLDDPYNKGNTLSSGLFWRLAENYPQVPCTRIVSKSNNNVPMSLWQDNDHGIFNLCDMLFFAGHGYKNYFCAYDAYGWYDDVWLVGANYGGFTKWVIHDACLTLNSDEVMNGSMLANGVHAVFGFQSESWDGEWFCCSWSWTYLALICSTVYSHQVYSIFTDKWIAGGEPLWNAWAESNDIIYHDNWGDGIAPAVITVEGWINDNGTWKNFSGRNETINNVYNGPVAPNVFYGGQWASARYYVVYGSPNY